MGVEGEARVQNDTQVANLRRRVDGAAIDGEEQISNLPEQCFGATTMSSVLLLLSLSRFFDIQAWMSRRQLTSDSGGSWDDGLVLM